MYLQECNVGYRFRIINGIMMNVIMIKVYLQVIYIQLNFNKIYNFIFVIKDVIEIL